MTTQLLLQQSNLAAADHWVIAMGDSNERSGNAQENIFKLECGVG
jgi:hypothetical protein